MSGLLGPILLIVAVSARCELSDSIVSTESVVRSDAGEPPESRPSLEEFAAVWNRDLRQPLFDLPPPTPVAAPPAPPPAPLPIKLVGTVIENGTSSLQNDRAIFDTAEGKTEFKAVGEKSGGAQVLRIQQDSVTVQYNDQTVELKVEKEVH